MTSNKQFSPQLLHLIHSTQESLALVIKQQASPKAYEMIVKLQTQLKHYMALGLEQRKNLLYGLYLQLSKQEKEDCRQIAHGFTLMIQLINACEMAYRSYRLSQSQSTRCQLSCNNAMIFVLTAHPTEARSPANIALFEQIRNICLARLSSDLLEDNEQQLQHFFKLAWLTPVAKHRRPTVIDEAQALFSTVLRSDILDEFIALYQHGFDIRLRTWVGGDKDGHPGVDERAMFKVMSLARHFFIDYVKGSLNLVQSQLSLTRLSWPDLYQGINHCRNVLKPLLHISEKDGLHLEAFKQVLTSLTNDYQQQVGMSHPDLLKLTSLLKLFPALIIPLEFREDASVIHQALKSQTPMAIQRMLQCANKFSQQSNVLYYVKDLVISMVQSREDIDAALLMVNQCLPNQFLRVVPLFETADALAKAPEILSQLFNDKSLKKQISEDWQQRFELMLGYSDSSKGMGVLASRLAIASVMREVNKVCEQHQITPIFFHGSGGSIDRGGGSIHEQTAWWPQSAFCFYKTTIQGEMVERSFASAAILRSTVDKLCTESYQRHQRELPHHDIVTAFADKVSDQYKAMLAEPGFLQVVSQATSYRLLNQLNFGSRPVKRSQALTIDGLRAIPWVLCWTQTRVLFPTWWGVGSSWQALTEKNRQKLRQAYQENSLFKTFITVLGFTLAKVDLAIWCCYLEASELPNELKKSTMIRFQQEYEQACEALYYITEQKESLCSQPWMQQSINLRSPLIHPLNILQIHAIDSGDGYLIRETTTGIASGMLTTG